MAPVQRIAYVRTLRRLNLGREWGVKRVSEAGEESFIVEFGNRFCSVCTHEFPSNPSTPPAPCQQHLPNALICADDDRIRGDVWGKVITGILSSWKERLEIGMGQ